MQNNMNIGRCECRQKKMIRKWFYSTLVIKDKACNNWVVPPRDGLVRIGMVECGWSSLEENGLQNPKRWCFTIISNIHLPPWKFTCVYSCLVQLINVMQCFPAFLSIIKEICLVTFNFISFVSFASNYLKPNYFSKKIIISTPST